MIVQHNLLANFTGRQLGINNRSKNKALEKLSGGYRINRAADDAAGLYISEGMRGQIRGLNQGARNVEDGISMINTAEGAIGEQINILQRIRVLTIESYNDTYTQDDRFGIQMEVDGLLEEVDRIAKDTEFNTIKVLQGPQEIVRKEIIEPSEEFTEKEYLISAQKKFPDWAIHDSKLQVGNTKVDKKNLQDTSQYIIFNEDQIIDPAKPETAYGPKPDSQDKIDADNWQGEWTTGMDDNYSAVVDFTEISTLTTKEELLNHLGELIGTGIGYECYTCERTQGVYFYSDDVRVRSVHNDERSGQMGYDFFGVDLQGCIDKVTGLCNEDEFQTDGTYGTYEDYVKATASEITEKIVDDIVKATQNNKDHYVRVKEDAANPYQVIFYDFRDKDVTDVNSLAGDVLEYVDLDLIAKIRVENEPMEFTSIDETGYWIQIGANSKQGVFIDFPDTSLEAIGLVDYNVFPYGYCSATEDKRYDPALLVGAEKIGDHLYRNEVGGEPGIIVEDSYTVSGTRTVNDITVKFATDPNGELKAKVEVIGTRTVPYSYTYTTYKKVGGTPGVVKEFYAYPPDSLLRVDHAINSLLGSRSYLGAMSNRLEHAWLNDMNASENLQYSESRIRDANIADEAVARARSSILEQAGFSMLAQANQASEGVLLLLR